MDRRQFQHSSLISFLMLAAWARSVHAISLNDLSGSDASTGLKAKNLTRPSSSPMARCYCHAGKKNFGSDLDRCSAWPRAWWVCLRATASAR
jgi:hypothetical protein